MKLLVCCLLALLAASTDASVVFSVTLPAGPSQREFVAALAGNVYWTMGSGGQLFSVNLTSRQLQATVDLQGTVCYALFGLPNGVVLAELTNNDFMAFDAKGNFLWTTNEFLIPFNVPNSWTVIGDLLFIASGAQLITVNTTTGNIVGSPVSYQFASLYSNMAVLTLGEFYYGPNTVIAYSLPDMTQLWSINYVQGFLGFAGGYAFLLNQTSYYDCDLLVYNAQTFTLLSTVEGLCELKNFNFNLSPLVLGDTAVFVYEIPEQNPCLLGRVNLLTGEFVYQAYLGETSCYGWSLIGNTSLVAMSQTTLTVIDLQTGDYSLQVNNVPFGPSTPSVVVGRGNTLVVPNLQGYTRWSTVSGTLLGRDETLPGFAATAASPYSWHGYVVLTIGNQVVVETP